VDRGTVEDFIDQTGALLDWAGEIVRDSGSLRARRVLGEATRLHSRSQSMLTQDHLAVTLSTSRRARAATFHAARLAREALVFSERFQLLSERFARRREDLQDKAQEGRNQMALDLLVRAEDQDIRAHEQYTQGDARQACRILEQVETLQNRAAGLLGVGPVPENLDALLSHTADRLDRAREMLGPGASARSLSLLKDAESALDRARDFQSRGMPGRALKTGELARDLIEKAMLGPMGPDDPAEVAQRQIENWDARESRIPPDLDAALVDLMSGAREHRRSAQAMLEDGRPLMALRQIKLAHDLLDQVERRSR